MLFGVRGMKQQVKFGKKNGGRSVLFVRCSSKQSKFGKSEWRKICSVCSERTVASEVRKIRGLEDLFGLFDVLVGWGSK